MTIIDIVIIAAALCILTVILIGIFASVHGPKKYTGFLYVADNGEVFADFACIPKDIPDKSKIVFEVRRISHNKQPL